MATARSLHDLETTAKALGAGLCGAQQSTFTSCDTLTVVWHPRWGVEGEYEYRHNGVRIERSRAQELVPWF